MDPHPRFFVFVSAGTSDLISRKRGGAIFLLLGAFCVIACTGDVAPDQPAHLSDLAVRAPQYELVADWPTLPAGIEFGDMSGVAIDSDGNVMVVHRGDRGFSSEDERRITAPVVVTLDAESGVVLQAWGSGTFMVPHGLSIDDDDNVWITDTGLHQVFKFTHDGQLLLALGEPGVPGWDEGHFNRPTQVAALSDGSFYVADGYVNSRVAKFGSDGNFLFEWGKAGNQPGQFDNPHGITLGSDGNLIVSDRENSRLQIFDQDGGFLGEWLGAKPTGRVFSATVGPDDAIYLAIRPQGRDPLRTGVLKLNREFEIVAQIGFSDSGDAVFNAAHYAAIGSDGALYLAETPDRRVSKYVPVAWVGGR